MDACRARAAIRGLPQSVLMVKSIIRLHTMAITAAHRHLKHDDSHWSGSSGTREWLMLWCFLVFSLKASSMFVVWQVQRLT